MSGNVVLYCEKLPTEGMETLIMELCPPELDLRFLHPVKNGKKGDFKDANYILASIRKIGKEEIDSAAGLKLIHVPATGYNHVDIAYANSKGIPVCNSRGENATTTAEFTIALMLACMRRLSQIDSLVKKGEWHSWTWRHDQYELRGKTVGIVGGGAIGKEVMKRLQGWDCRLIYSDPFRMPIELEQKYDCEYVSFESLLEQSDVVSLHCRLAAQRQKMLDNKCRHCRWIYCRHQDGYEQSQPQREPVLCGRRLGRRFSHTPGGYDRPEQFAYRDGDFRQLPPAAGGAYRKREWRL